MDYLERSKKEWARASEFPTNKEHHYPEHTIVQEFDSHKGKLVYEYGIGGGSDLMSYLRRNNRVWGTDIVPENVETSRKRLSEAGFKEGTDFNLVLLEDSYPLPFEDDFFDIASSHGVLHHIINPDPVVKEIHRVLKPGGLIYVMLYSTILYDHHKELGQIDYFKTQYNISDEEAFCYCTDNVGVPYAIPYSTEMGYDLLERNGFEVLDYNYWLNDFFVTYKGVRVE